MSIGYICTRNVVVAEKDISIREVGLLMRDKQVGCVVILEDVEFLKKPIGIITDRDIVLRVLLKDLNVDETKVADVMTSQIVTIQEMASIQNSLEFMRLEKVRRVPVVNSQDELVGIVTANDIIENITDELHELSRLIKNK